MISSPIQGQKIKVSSGDKEIEFKSYKDDFVRSPMDGYVSEIDTENCGGEVVIEFLFNGEKS